MGARTSSSAATGGVVVGTELPDDGVVSVITRLGLVWIGREYEARILSQACLSPDGERAEWFHHLL